MIKKFEKIDFLQDLILRSLSEDKRPWFLDKINLLSGASSPKDLYLCFSTATQMLGREEIQLSNKDNVALALFNPSFTLKGWTVDAAARIAMLISYDKGNETEFISTIKPLFETAEARELETIFAGISLLPYPELLYSFALESVRTNISSAFNAMLYSNPYPMNYFDELNWNQLIIKAVFNNQSLENVVGLTERKNQNLAQMAFDLLDERWAANRDVSVYIWKLISGYINEDKIRFFTRVFDTGSMKHKYAAIASLIEDDTLVSKKILSSFDFLSDEYYLRSPDYSELHLWPYHS